jgi:hypothetical protein
MVGLLHPGQQAVGFEHSSSEVLGQAQAFNEMLERLERKRRESSGRVLAAQETERLRIARELRDELGAKRNCRQRLADASPRRQAILRARRNAFLPPPRARGQDHR